METNINQDDHIKQKIISFEKERESASKKTTIAGIIIIPLGLFTAIKVGMAYGHAFPAIIIAILSILVVVGLNSLFFSDLKANFKHEVIGSIIKKINPHLDYIPSKHLDESVFKESTLFPSRYNRFKGEDLIYGQQGETHFQLSELSVKYNDNDDTTTVFEGLFIEADFHKHFHSRTFIKPDTILRGVGLNKKRWEGASLTEMEDLEFEDTFRVFTTDEQDARYILSSTMMNRITALQKKFNCPIHISFLGTKMYVAIETGNMNFLDKHTSSYMDKDKTFDMISSELEFILSTIDDLNLNTRIWSKQEGLLDLPEIEPIEREEDDLYFSE